MNHVAQIVEIDQERDRKTCVSLDLKVTGANRELAQWIADHRGRYSSAVIGRWLGRSESGVSYLRQWAERGFVDSPRGGPGRRPDNAKRHHHGGDPALETNDNSKSDDDADPEITEPNVLEDNILHAIGGMNENARVFNKLLRVSALDREAVARINTAIDRMMGKWRSIQSTLEKKG